MNALERKATSLASTIGFSSIIWLASLGVYFVKGRSSDLPNGASEAFLTIFIIVSIGMTIKFFLGYLKSKRPYVAFNNGHIEIHNKALGQTNKFKTEDVSLMRVHNEELKGSIKIELNDGEKHFIQFSENLNVEDIVKFVKSNSNIDAALWE